MRREKWCAGLLSALAVAVVSSCNESTPTEQGVGSEPRPGPAATVTVLPDTATIEVGQQVAVSAEIRDASGRALYGHTVAWSSSQAIVATVSNTGMVTGIAAGTANIVATSDGKTGSMTVTVVPSRVAKVIVSPDAPIIWVRSQVTLGAQVQDSRGQNLVGRVVTWSSSDPTVVTVSPDGIAQGIAGGSAIITATCEGNQGTATVIVRIGFLVVTPPSDLAVGGSIQLIATPKDSSGRVITSGPVSWSSSDPTIASVDPASGVVRGVATGIAAITASAPGFRPDSTNVGVMAPLPPGLVETDLGDLGGGQSQATGINDAGVVVGWSRTASGDTHPFRWTAGGGMQDLGTLGGTSGAATAINGLGDIVGYSTVAGGAGHAFRWTASSGMQDLGVLPGGNESAAFAINGTGEVGGESSGHAVRWNPAGQIEDLGTGAGQAQVLGINDVGEAVGSSSFNNCDFYYCYDGVVAYFWGAAGNGSELNSGATSVAEDINNFEQIVGQSFGGYRISVSGTQLLQPLTPLSPGSSDAHALNEVGEVVGRAQAASGLYHPVFWSVTGDIAPLSLASGDALGINGVKQIVGYSSDGQNNHAKMWTLGAPAAPSAARVRVSR